MPIVEIEGVMFQGAFNGFAEPLTVVQPAGGTFALLPWRYADHMAALRQSLFLGDHGLLLDSQYFASRVLGASGIAEAHLPALAPIALWWAGGGEDAPPHEADDLGTCRATLRPWTEAERLAALRAASRAGSFDPPLYLDRMVRASALAFAPEMQLDRLDSLATARLLDAVARLNMPDPADDPLLSGGAEEARAMLALCRALGWTPAEILAAPAAEIDRMRRLLALAEPAPQRAARPGGRLADFADATVIRFGDDA
nr:hypothetical protein [uncultured Rhodopila sp.]